MHLTKEVYNIIESKCTAIEIAKQEFLPEVAAHLKSKMVEQRKKPGFFMMSIPLYQELGRLSEESYGKVLPKMWRDIGADLKEGAEVELLNLPVVIASPYILPRNQLLLFSDRVSLDVCDMQTEKSLQDFFIRVIRAEEIMMLKIGPKIESLVEVLGHFGTEASILEDMKVYKDKDKMPKKALNYCLNRGEYSVLQHCFVKIRLNRIPIPSAVHYVRHDDLKFSVKSLRTDYESFEFADPWHLEENDPELLADYQAHNAASLDLYKRLLETNKPEQARWVLPTGTCTNLILSGRLSDIFFMLTQRYCEHADDVTADYAERIFDALEALYPTVAKHFRNRCYHSTKLCKECVREE